MAVARRDYWRRRDQDSDSDDDSEDEDEEETYLERITENSKRIYEFGKGWSTWGWGKTKNGIYEICAHTFFVALPFAIIIMQQTVEEQKWDHTLKIATSDIEKKTMQSMGSKMAGLGNVPLPPISQS
eukprot:CAMPEP_0201565428 /NCGR_PEP_ID=MMETSP0190_2-20130828/4543_1 /ASSEMBLY_ACC=CAM_ASM_000263 /TAXON_ID=37353 /ORGANISM="Rosalina sp." /LENGTH=126 /DNA_ID=CAMNT_0047982911 /DNA_START=70 /DNA_END=450 /DNA_ORIENTATION=+